MKNLKGKFKLNSWKRMVILGATIIGALLAIVLGSIFYTAKPENIRKSGEYAGGAEYVIKVETPTNSNLNVTDVADEIYQRIDSLGIQGVKVSTEKNSSGQFVRVNYSGLKSQEEIDKVEYTLTHKPHLVLTDTAGHPLFTANGTFDYQFGSRSIDDIISQGLYETSHTPLTLAHAKRNPQTGRWEIAVQVESQHINDWTTATAMIAMQAQQGAQAQPGTPTPDARIVAWLDIDSWIKDLKATQTTNGNLWDDAQHNPFNAAYINNDPNTNKLRDNPKYSISTAPDHMISAAAVTQALNSRDFVISGNFNAASATELARKINFGAAEYTLKKEMTTKFDATYGHDAFKKAVIAGIIAFSIISIFLVVNYGLLGALSTISIALFTFITLTLFTVMRGEYSPESIAALIIGMGMSVDANIITFERLKNEIYRGHNLQKADKIANKKSFWTIFDANITTLIIAVVLFYFGTRNIVGLSITLMLSILLTLIVMLGFTRFVSTMLVRSGFFDNRLKWLGVHEKFDTGVQAKINKVDFVKSSKWFIYLSAAIFFAGLVTLTVLAAVAGNINGGFNLSSEFKAGSLYQFNFDDATAGRHLSDVRQLMSGVPGVHETIVSSNGTSGVVKFISDSGNIPNALSNLVSTNTEWKNNYFFSNTSPDMAAQLIKDAMIAIAIAMGLIIVYTLIRFRWTYAIAAIAALIHDGLIVTSVFVFARLEISPVFIAGLLAILGYSINDTIVTFDRIREKMSAKTMGLDAAQVKQIANEAVRDTLKRSLLTSLTTILAVVVLVSFNGATKLEFNIAMLVGLFFGTYSSIFIATFIWVKLEVSRQKGMVKRQKNNFWKTNAVEEQTIVGINDFKY